MSKKNLLNESQVRQFMKLANLQPLSPGFVHGLTEKKQGADDREDEHLGAEDGKEADKKQSEKDRRKEMRGARRAKGESGDPVPTQESHSRGRKEGAAGYGSPDQNSRNEGLEDDLDATEDELGDEDDFADEEGDEIDDLEGELDVADDELGAEEGGRMVSVDDFLEALESALETAMGDEVEVDASEMSDEVEDEEDLEAEDDFAPEGEEVVADDEIEDEMLEGFALGGKSAREKGWEKIAKGSKDSYEVDPEAGEEEARKWSPEEIAADDEWRKKNPRKRFSAFDRQNPGGMKIGGITAEGQDALVEQITKRVAARILKAALTKK